MCTHEVTGSLESLQKQRMTEEIEHIKKLFPGFSHDKNWKMYFNALEAFNEGHYSVSLSLIKKIAGKLKFAGVYILQARIYIEQGALISAIKMLKEALALTPDQLESLSTLSYLLLSSGDHETLSALHHFIEAQDFFTDHCRDNPLLLESVMQVEAHHILSCYALPQYTNSQIYEMTRKWAKRFVGPEKETPAFEQKHEGKIRVAYLSHEWVTGPLHIMYDGLFEHINREQFELIALVDSTLPAFVGYQRQYFDEIIWVKPFSGAEFAACLREKNIDILVDLAGFLNPVRLRDLTYRAAPVQINAGLNPPFTTGVSSFDAFFNDSVLFPPTHKIWLSEKELLYFPVVFHFKAPVEPRSFTPPPLLHNGFPTFGISSSLKKHNESSYDLWCQVLQAIPQAQLKIRLLYDSEEMAKKVLFAFKKRGIATHRIQLHQKQEGVGLYTFFEQIDILLDAFPYANILSACEAFWTGVPVLSLDHERGLASMLRKHLELPHGLYKTPQAFVQGAVSLSKDRNLLTQLRKSLRQHIRNSPVYDNLSFARQSEKYYLDLLAQTRET